MVRSSPSNSGRAVMVRAASACHGNSTAFRHLLTDAVHRDALSIFVTYTQTPDELWQTVTTTCPVTSESAAIVTLGEFSRSARSAATVQLPSGQNPTVLPAPPDEPVIIGRVIAEFLDAHGVTMDAAPQDVVCYFDSLTMLLQYVDLSESFRFLHMLTTQLRTIGARAHFLIDPAAHDSRSIARIRPLFDDVIRVPPDDTCTPDRDTSRPETASSNDELDADTIFSVLSNRRRRLALRFLAENGAISVRELADITAKHETDDANPSERRKQSAYIALQQTHIPTLAECNLVTYDGASKTIATGSNFAAIEPYLDLGGN